MPANQLGDWLPQVARKQCRPAIRRGRVSALYDILGRGADFAGELVAPSGDRADQFALRPEGGAQRRNLGLQGVLLDDPVRPDTGHQRVLADDCAVRLNKHHQHVVGAAAQLERLAVGQHLAAMRQQSITTKLMPADGSDTAPMIREYSAIQEI